MLIDLPVVFLLRSKELFKTESEVNESVNGLIDNLLYWQKDEFREYFSVEQNSQRERNN